MKKVSICIPTYNNASEVKRLLDSIKIQDYSDYEVIISDDSNNQEIEKMICEEYVGLVNYHHNEKPLGHIYNWNKAISYASGEYIKIMFSDDWFTESDSLGKLVDLLDVHTEMDFAFSGNLQVSSSGMYAREAGKDYIEKLQKDYRYLFVSNQIGAPSNTIYRRSTGALFDEKSNWASDVFLYLELLKSGKGFVYTTEPLISIGIHDNQYTESFCKKDKRISDDYRYMFIKYGLNESKMCKEHFINTYLLPYYRSPFVAAECGYDVLDYTVELISFFIKDTLWAYTKALFHKLKGKK